MRPYKLRPEWIGKGRTGENGGREVKGYLLINPEFKTNQMNAGAKEN